MAYSSGFLHNKIVPLNRKAAVVGKYGVDSGGVQWTEGPCLHANVDYQRGKSAMSAGALDAYAVKIVRMRWTNVFTERSRIKFNGKIYQIMAETWQENRRENTLQFLMQQVTEKQSQQPAPAPTPSSSEI